MQNRTFLSKLILSSIIVFNVGVFGVASAQEGVFKQGISIADGSNPGAVMLARGGQEQLMPQLNVNSKQRVGLASASFSLGDQLKSFLAPVAWLMISVLLGLLRLQKAKA